MTPLSAVWSAQALSAPGVTVHTPQIISLDRAPHASGVDIELSSNSMAVFIKRLNAQSHADRNYQQCISFLVLLTSYPMCSNCFTKCTHTLTSFNVQVPSFNRIYVSVSLLEGRHYGWYVFIIEFAFARVGL